MDILRQPFFTFLRSALWYPYLSEMQNTFSVSQTPQKVNPSLLTYYHSQVQISPKAYQLKNSKSYHLNQ